MIPSAMAARFWAAVEDCLVTFHHLEASLAAEQVTSLWRRLSDSLSVTPSAMADMVYHSEPWYIACNLAQEDLAITAFRSEYSELLRRHGLNPGSSQFTVILTAAGTNKVKVVKTIRELTRLSFEEAKSLVESTPKPIRYSANKEEAEAIRQRFSDVGASVELKSAF